MAVGIGGTLFAVQDYQNFDLPETKQSISVAPESKLNFESQRVKLRGTRVRLKEPSLDTQQLIFAKEALISEKRDEAIKLLRQEMDAGYRANRDNMLLRLGQLYAEKYMELSYRENEVFSAQIREYEEKKAGNPSVKAPTLDTGRSRRYLQDAKVIFSDLEKEYPKHPKIDEVIFFIGFVEIESGKPEKGAKYLERVLREFPKSRKYEEAAVYLGDHYFDRHQFDRAITQYSILRKRLQASLHDYALYKLAWCRLNVGQAEVGLKEMKSLVGQLEGNSDKSKFNLREQALKDLIAFYAEVGRVEEAIEFFTQTQGKEKAAENLKLIAEVLRVKAKPSESVKAYETLLSWDEDSLEAPKYILGLYDGLASLGKTDKAANVLVNALERFGEGSDWAKRHKKNADDVKSIQESLAAEAARVAMFNHQAGQRSSSPGHYQAASRLYTVLLKSFPNYPDKKKISFYKAEILYGQNKWVEAADQYMIVARHPPKEKLNEEAVYNALLALDHVTTKAETIERYSKEEQKKVSTEPKEIPDEDSRFIDVAVFFVREYPTAQRVVDVKFRIASLHYRYNHFDKAMDGYKEIAIKYPGHRSATTAAHLVLDTYNIKKQYSEMNETAALFAKMPSLGDQKFKGEMAQIASEINFKNIEALERDSKWREAGSAYYSFYKSNPTGPLAEKSLYNAIVSFEKAEDATMAAETTRLFLVKFPKSEETQRFTLVQAKNSEKIYDFDQAQKGFLEFYRKFPKAKEAKKALFNAAVYAELLELNGLAISLYQQYLKEQKTDREEEAAIDLSLAKLYRKEGAWEKLTAMFQKLIRRESSVEGKLALWGDLISAYESGKRISEKKWAVGQMVWFYDSNKGRKLTGPGIQYVAEAKFLAVEKKKVRYQEVGLRFPEVDLVYLLKRKQKLLTQLIASYDEVIEVGVPEWGVAAVLEKGKAYVHFVDHIKRLSVPKSYKDEARVEAEKGLQQISEQIAKPFELKAREIFKACVSRAAEFHVANDFATQCFNLAGKDTAPAPMGILPKPSYWSTRASTKEIARP